MTSPDRNEPPASSNRPAAPERKPWPMWPIALSIVAFMGVYTYINLQYRKEGKAYEPFQAIMDRVNAPVEKNFYDWYGLKSTPAESVPFEEPAVVAVTDSPATLENLLPDQVKLFLASRPILAPMPRPPESPAASVAGEPLRLRIWLPDTLGDDERFKLLAFYKEGELYLLPTLFVDEAEKAADALTGPPQAFGFEIPTEPFAAEAISVRFLAEDQVAEWTLANRVEAAAPSP